MYSSISFATFQIHAGHDVDSNTLSKTTATYQKLEYLHLPTSLHLTSKEIKSIARKKSELIKGINNELYPHFIWHLN
jgi:hypothetical protein